MQSYLDGGKVILTDENGDYYGISQLYQPTHAILGQS
jgi:hypothetical protein